MVWIVKDLYLPNNTGNPWRCRVARAAAILSVGQTHVLPSTFTDTAPLESNEEETADILVLSKIMHLWPKIPT